MTRKDYVLIAKAINGIYLDATWNEHSILVALVEDMADALQHDNPAFDRDRFKKACLALT